MVDALISRSAMVGSKASASEAADSAFSDLIEVPSDRLKVPVVEERHAR